MPRTPAKRTPTKWDVDLITKQYGNSSHRTEHWVAVKCATGRWMTRDNAVAYAGKLNMEMRERPPRRGVVGLARPRHKL